MIYRLTGDHGNCAGQAEARPRSGWAGIAWLVPIVLFVIALRLRLLDLPLERDEGEYAYVGQLILQGIAPFQQAYVIKLPGTDFVYAASMALFGQTPAGVHAGLLLASVSAVVLLFLLTRRWFGPQAGLVAAATYGLMSTGWMVRGNAAHATQFIVPAALGAILLLLRGMEAPRPMVLFWSGFLFGLAFILKQPGLLFGFFGGAVLLAGELSKRPVPWRASLTRLAVFSGGCALPFALLCLMSWRAGVLARFWEWSFLIAGGRWRNGWEQLQDYRGFAAQSPQQIFWYLAAAALPLVFWLRLARPVEGLFWGFCAASLAAVCPGFQFHPHYFVLALPAVGMSIGLAVAKARERWKDRRHLAFLSVLPAAIFIGLCIYAVESDGFYFFLAGPEENVRLVYPLHPFTEAIRVADYIRTHSAPDARIAVLGSEPEIYFYARRRSATGHVSTYLLMEDRPFAGRLQREMIDEIERAQPAYVVYVNNSLSWDQGVKSDVSIFNWALPYCQRHYQVVGVVDGVAPAQPVYRWDAQAAGYTPKSKNWMLVFKRTD